MICREFEQWFYQLLNLEPFEQADASMNGLQVGRRDKPLERIALAVDACAETFRRAADGGADALVVHHGLFWGQPLSVTGSHYQRISLLLDHDIALFAAHLPLDAHLEVGNNAGIADALGLKSIQPFGAYHGQMIGLQGLLETSLTVPEVLQLLGWEDEPDITVLPFGSERIRKVGVVSGGAAGIVDEAIQQGCDLFITGESSHQVYHTCLESGINMIAGGHYRTETYGVQLLGQRIEQETGISTFFIDLPTGL